MSSPRPNGEPGLHPNGETSLLQNGEIGLQPNGKTALCPNGEISLYPNGETCLKGMPTSLCVLWVQPTLEQPQNVNLKVVD